MKVRSFKCLLSLALALLMLFSAACGGPKPAGTDGDTRQEDDGQELSTQEPEEGSEGTASQIQEGQSFAEAHDAFQTTLTREDSDSDSIPEPPEGLFDLVAYPSNVGDLAAYVSSDPGDGEKHPMIIWVVGGWGNGIDDFPFCYPAWDNDQTGSAFWQAGILTMYPSFRGGNGNPGHYETLFGEVDDIISAYEYAASLPYVDPNRIYLGGHSTGGTRVLLAAEHTDKFRAVFGFGAVDEIKYHNSSQFTFDVDNEEEHIMRSPIHWLDDVKTPTFLIEGKDGNSGNLKRMQEATDNENIHCYIMEEADHFSTLAPLTRLVAEKILADTGEEVNISITQEELDGAMASDPVIPIPAMSQYTIDELGLEFSCPYIWNVDDTSSEDNGFELTMYSRYEDDNIWDMAVMYLSIFSSDGGESYLDDVVAFEQSQGYTAEKTTVAGQSAMQAVGVLQDSNGSNFRNLYTLIEKDGVFYEFDFYIHEDYGEDADALYDAMIESVQFVE